MLISFGVFLLALAASLALTPLAACLARQWGWLDHPDQKLKKHVQPVPYGGGVAVFVSFLLALVAFKFWEGSTLVGVVGVTAGTSLIVLLGLVDDRFQLSPAVKFAGQTLAALTLYACNMRLQFIEPPLLSLLLSLLWVVGVTNALNLIDIMDGLAAGTAAIAAAVFFMIAAQNGRYNDMYILAALGGAALGFLPYNFPRARVYLGDTGALMLGFVLSSIAMGEAYTRVNPLAVLTPLLILGVPIFDTLFIMFLRHRRGVSMFRGSPDHLALRMVKTGLTRQQTVLLLWGASLALGGLAYAGMRLPLTWSLFLYLGVAAAALFIAERMGSFSMESHAPSRESKKAGHKEKKA
ncbi:MAG: MraY family glycosyltransferase [candidate division FCPU426 bacterium]